MSVLPKDECPRQLMYLPCELRAMIWNRVEQEDIQEVCILLADHDQRRVLAPLTVDTAFPVLMHVCRESRASAAARTRFRFSPAARIRTPFRRFRPELDILCVPGMDALLYGRAAPPPGQSLHQEAEDEGGEDSPPLPLVRHLALGFWTQPMAAFVLVTFPRLRSLSLVLRRPDGQPMRAGTGLGIPVRRCQLRRVEVGRAGSGGGGGPGILSDCARVDRGAKGVAAILQRLRCDLFRGGGVPRSADGRPLGCDDGSGYVPLDLSARYFATWQYGPSEGTFRDRVEFPDGFERCCADSHVHSPEKYDPEQVRVNDVLQ
ncbi:uncharacterized protein JN550_004105 [Neoarthrinium moseri]|uniref:uncharacterized protein n=1 Tax=Neoarthrinium moseri TaxID=1658444 RepID=UPI001FDCB4FA|nr:uncharacterized protein JN550_004105 [Neoarthrinium moseri]KAI1872386.1 hypothetical protein JN550_004105 [Neoarthrinium moseri]